MDSNEERGMMMQEQVQSLLSEITTGCSKILEDNITGIYLHGSLAFGCFSWETGDIDFIIVTEKAPSLEQKIELIQFLLRIDSKCPPKGMEMSLVLHENCNPFRYPTPFELHFSNFHRERCRADVKKYCQEMHGTDRDLAAHFTVIRSRGIALCGKPIPEVFGEVPEREYWDSICRDVAEAPEEILHQPVYMVLNLCRVLAYRKSRLILSKAEGEKWGREHLPEKYQGIIRAAGESYQTGSAFPQYIEKVLLQAFAKEMLKEIL